MIPKEETLKVEFKSDIRKLPDADIFDAVVAFANTDGGEIYLGVENDGSVTGVHKAHENPITLGAYIANNTVPPISVRTEILSGDKPVLKISVPKLSGGIAATASGKILRRQIKLDGTPENIPMYPQELPTRLSHLRLLDYSAMPIANASVDDFDPLELARLRSVILANEGDSLLLELQDEDLYKALGFAKEAEGRLAPTITGLLMIGRTSSIETHIPTHAVSFQVLEASSVLINEDMNLPLLAAYEKISTMIDARNPEREIELGTGLYRMSVPAFHRRAIREAIVNAFSHRDYTKMGRVRVCVSDEGLTIANPGGFVEGVTIHNLLTAEPFGRNPLLSDALKRVGLAEKTGRGIDRIYEGSLIYGKRPPDYAASTSTTVSLLIPRCAPDPDLIRVISNEQLRLGRPLTLPTLLIMNVLRDKPNSNVRRLSSLSGMSADRIVAILDNAVEAGYVEARGFGARSTYKIANGKYSVMKNNTEENLIGEKHVEYQARNERNRLLFSDPVLALALSQEYISRKDVMRLLHLSGPQAYRVLKKLSAEGELEPVNKGRYSKYRLA